MAAGLRVERSDFEAHVNFQTTLLEYQLNTEDVFYHAAKLYDKDVVIIYDRGTMDGKGFSTPEEWEAVLDETRTTETYLRDKRYDAVIHLESAAVNAPAFYTTENNAQRRENVTEAALFDAKVLKAWIGHPHLKIIRSRDNFQDKMNDLLKVVGNVVGIPMALEIERKFLVESTSQFEVVNTSEIEQTYLETIKGQTERVRKRTYLDGIVYTHTVKRPVGEGQNIEEERIIDAKEYNNLLKRKDMGLFTVRKTRSCFVHENQYFELDTFKDRLKGLCILEVELDDIKKEVILPPFVNVTKEVTDDPSYSNYGLASKIL